jgi:hypothetical protein
MSRRLEHILRIHFMIEVFIYRIDGRLSSVSMRMGIIIDVYQVKEYWKRKCFQI